MWISFFLVLSILTGQLIKFPLFGIQGPILLDFFVFLTCLLGIFHLKFKLKKPKPTIVFGLIFTVISTFSLVLTPLHLKLNEYAISFSYTVRFFLYLLLGWIIYSGAFLNFKKQLNKTLLLSGVGLAILGLLQLIFFPNLEFLQNMGWDPHYFRTVSTFLDPNFAGAFFVLTLLLIGSDKKSTKPAILFFVTIYLALLTTFSRSSYLMFLTSGLVYAFLVKSRKTAIFTGVLFT